MTGAAAKILTVFEEVIGVRFRSACDVGTVRRQGHGTPPAQVHFRNRRALRRVLYSPNELGLARAYVSGDLDVDGDIFALLDVPELVTRLGENRLSTLPLRSVVRAAGTFAGLGAVGPPPSPPAIEMRSKRGKRHSRSRDSATVSHHYDVGNRFYELFLGPSMVYSCGYWPEGVESLEAAQYAAGLDLPQARSEAGNATARRRLRLGIDGITRRPELRRRRRRSLAEQRAGRIRQGASCRRGFDRSHRDSGAGLPRRRRRPLRRDFEHRHVRARGLVNLPVYTAKLYDLLVPQGRLLNHASPR